MDACSQRLENNWKNRFATSWSNGAWSPSRWKPSLLRTTGRALFEELTDVVKMIAAREAIRQWAYAS
jgi:hypothetical protein